jgi:hypothetical protein
MAGENGSTRRSRTVSLSIVGLAGAVWIADGVIPEGVEMRRNLYTDRAACERDYSPSQCESDGTYNSGGYVGSSGYHGPYYAASRSTAVAGDPGSGRSGVMHTAYTTSYRGGFGAFGHAVHAAA